MNKARKSRPSELAERLGRRVSDAAVGERSRRIWIPLAAGVAFVIACQAGDAMAQTSGNAPEPYAGGDPVAGEALARKTCASCHVVARGQQASQRLPIGPDFPEIADLPSTTALSLAAFLRSPHARMPNLVLSADELKNVIAYIMSLRKRG